jgi:hypothetical protein
MGWLAQRATARLGYGYDALAPMYYDPISGDGVLFQFQTNTLWSYNPDAKRWTELTPEGDPMPKGKSSSGVLRPGPRRNM